MPEHFSEKSLSGAGGMSAGPPLAGSAIPDAVASETMDGLRDLMGEQRFGALLLCIADDLERVVRCLSLAAETSDTRAVRAQSHILIGLAVTIGADDLGEAGRRLNAAARDADLDLVQMLAPGVVEGAEAVARRMTRERDRLRLA